MHLSLFVGRCVCWQPVFDCIRLCSSVSVCLAGVFLILGVDILEDKGPI